MVMLASPFCRSEMMVGSDWPAITRHSVLSGDCSVLHLLRMVVWICEKDWPACRPVYEALRVSQSEWQAQSSATPRCRAYLTK